MNQKVLIFIIRAALGLLGGWFLTSFFLTSKGRPLNWFLVIVLAVLVVAAAYGSEFWTRRKNKD